MPLLCTGQVLKLNNNLVSIDASGNTTITGDLTYALRHGEMVIEGATYTPNLTQNVWFKMVPGMTVTEQDNITLAADSITITTAGSYLVTFTITFSAANGDDFMVGIAKNGTVVRNVRRTTTGATNYQGAMVQKYMDNLVVGDDISFYIMNITDNDDPTIISTYVYVRKEY